MSSPEYDQAMAENIELDKARSAEAMEVSPAEATDRFLGKIDGFKSQHLGRPESMRMVVDQSMVIAELGIEMTRLRAAVVELTRHMKGDSDGKRQQLDTRVRGDGGKGRTEGAGKGDQPRKGSRRSKK